MKSLLRYLILLLILFGLQAGNVKAVTKSWAGGAAGDVSNWNNGANWSPAGVPAAADDVNIGALLFFTNPPVVNAGDNVSCASITFGVILSLTTVPLTVNGTLNVTTSITQQPTLLISYSVPLSGTGTLNCGSIQINNNSNPGSALLGIFPSLNFIVTLQNLNVSGNVTVNSTTVVALVIPLGEIDGRFSLVSGTTTIGGQILTQNTLFRILGLSNSIGNPVFSIDPPTGSTATLILTNANPINTTPVSGSTYAGSIDFYNSTGTGQATVNYAYAGASVQTVYATTGISNLDISPALYQNLTFTSTGNKRPSVSSGLLTVAGNIDNSASSPIDFVTNTNTVQLTGPTGATQTIAGGSYVSAPTTGTVFYNLTSSATTATLSGRNNIAAKGTLAFLKTNNTTMNVDATASNSLTLLSNSTGDASIASLSADASAVAITATVTGTINVQRYVKGGGGSTGPRRYMLISSPVANASASTYNLLPFFATTYISGPGGAGNGFDTSPQNNPSVFIYDENAPLTSNPNLVTGNEFKGFATINETVPMGNGLEYYFRGSRSGVLSSAVFISPFPAPDINATLNFSGAVYKGAGAGGAFTTSIINFPATPPTYYSSSAVTLSNNLSFASSAPTKKGLNLVGNPYPSVIDLSKVYSVNGNAYKFYYMLVKNVTTGTNSFSTTYAVYDATNGGTPPAGASKYAVSGQGFFITAPNATTTLIFNESMKVPYSSYTSPASTKPVFNVIRNPLVVASTLAVSPDKSNTQQVAVAAPASAETNIDPIPRLRLEMMRDTNILNTADIAFDKNSNAKFVLGEDAQYIAASGQGDFFYSQSADSVGCFVNYTGNLEKLKRINLFIAFSNFGQYKITSPIKSNIDERYTIYLKDKYTNDSLDVVHNPVYTFNVDQNAASYPRDRFYLSIGIAPGHEYKLLGFSGTKVTSGIQLTWKTDNESNFTGFAVEKSTNSGKSFVVIDTLQSTGAGSYTFTDPAPGNGQITYRLSQSLVTGDTQLSKNLVFDYNGDLNILKFMVYPTSTAGDIHIKLGKTYSNNIKINIISTTGGLVKTLTTTDTDSVQENVGNLIKGLYIVEAIDVTTGKRIGSAKFFKQ